MKRAIDVVNAFAASFQDRNDTEREVLIEWNGALAVPTTIDVVVDVRTGKNYVRVNTEIAPFEINDLRTPEEFEDEILDAIAAGRLTRDDGARYPLTEVQERYAREQAALDATDRRRNELEEDW